MYLPQCALRTNFDILYINPKTITPHVSKAYKYNVWIDTWTNHSGVLLPGAWYIIFADTLGLTATFADEGTFRLYPRFISSLKKPMSVRRTFKYMPSGRIRRDYLFVKE